MNPAQNPQMEKFTVARRSVYFVKESLGDIWWRKRKSAAPIVKVAMAMSRSEDIVFFISFLFAQTAVNFQTPCVFIKREREREK